MVDGTKSISVTPAFSDTGTNTMTLNAGNSTTGMQTDSYKGNLTITATNTNEVLSKNLIVDVDPKMCTKGILFDKNLRNKQTDSVSISIEIESPEDDDEIEAGDVMDIEVTVTNERGDDTDVVVEAILYDMENGDELVSVESDSISLDTDDDEEEAVDLTLTVPMDVDSNDIRLFVKAYEDGNEDENCNYESVELDFNRENDDVRVSEFSLNKEAEETYTCGETVTATVN